MIFEKGLKVASAPLVAILPAELRARLANGIHLERVFLFTDIELLQKNIKKPASD